MLSFFFDHRETTTTTTTEQDYKTVLKAVERGDKSAKTKLAWYKLSGVGGCEIDVDGAVALLEKRVKANDAEAMWMLGVCYEFGRGCEQDIEKAELLYCKSRKKNNVNNILVWYGKWTPKGSGYLTITRL